jgi:hypothetical protein
MKECVLNEEGTLSISDRQEDLFDQERFKARMSRWLDSVDELWDEYEKLKKYSSRQKE